MGRVCGLMLSTSSTGTDGTKKMPLELLSEGHSIKKRYGQAALLATSHE